MRLDTIVAYTDPDNVLSMAVLNRAGFTEVKSEHSDRKFEQKHPINNASMMG